MRPTHRMGREIETRCAVAFGIKRGRIVAEPATDVENVAVHQALDLPIDDSPFGCPGVPWDAFFRVFTSVEGIEVEVLTAGRFSRRT